MTEEGWRALQAIATGAPLYLRWTVVETLRDLGFVSFSWSRRGLVVTPIGYEAIRANEFLEASEKSRREPG
jgi:hypothetical protein